MAKSTAATVEEYLAELPADRRETIGEVRKLIRKHLPKGYCETMNWGMISYEIPLKVYRNTYNQQPLSYAALASQKNYCTLYLMSAYQDSEQEAELKKAFETAGKKLDMGKCCIRFKKAEDLALDAIASAIASTPPQQFIAIYEASRALTKQGSRKK